MAQVTVLGDGAWGTAIAHLLATNGHVVTIWCHSREAAHAINFSACNTVFLSDIELPLTVRATTDFEVAFKNTEMIFEAIPVKFLRTVLMQGKKYVPLGISWVLLSKGIEVDTLKLPSDILRDFFPEITCAVLAGPSYAYDLALGQPTGVTIATPYMPLAQHVCELTKNKYFDTEISTDMCGAQAYAALKNCAALALGMLEGAGYGENAKALIFTHLLQEMVLLNKHFGGQLETAFNFCGIGDLVLTSYGSKSRNRIIGVALGTGKKLEALLAQSVTVPESVTTLSAVQHLCNLHNIDVPMFSALYDIVYREEPIACLFTQTLCSLK